MTNRPRANSLHTLESLRRRTSWCCYCSQPVSRMLATHGSQMIDRFLNWGDHGKPKSGKIKGRCQPPLEQTVFYDRFQPLAGPGNNENPFLFQNKTRKPAFCPAFAPPLHEKKPFDSFDVIYDLYEKKQFHWLLCVAKNCDWSRKIAPLSNLSRESLFVEWKLTAKGELNCEIYKSWRKWWKNQVSFRHRSSPVY